ncbi:hypothetical protein [Corynebacterium sp.]|uniref:hypothetical protein n=1 Tax=Corynebacterium sp. TaxID=1720 RepID=UPI0026DBF395|nr:hypothetical protein [Corynebacterium sp.]MDO5031414.1 hypothetical protein [Corynebacterium sp.]
MRLSTSLLAACALSTSLLAPVAGAQEAAPTDSTPAAATAAESTADAATNTDGADGADGAEGNEGEGSSSDKEGSNQDGSAGNKEGSVEKKPGGGSSMNVGKIDTSDLSEECKAEVKQAEKDHEEAVANGTAGSSFMGPQELIFGILDGYGSSGMPKVPDCVDADKKAALEKKWDEMPDWLQSARPNETVDEVFAWIGGFLGLLAAGLQATIIMAKIDPSILDGLRYQLKKAGFTW